MFETARSGPHAYFDSAVMLLFFLLAGRFLEQAMRRRTRAVAGNLAAADANGVAGKVINVACGRQFTLLDLIGAINRVLGTDIEPAFEPARAGDVYESLADITLARELLGYAPTIDFDEGLRRSIEYYRSLS